MPDTIDDMTIRHRLRQAFDTLRLQPSHLPQLGFRLANGVGGIDGARERRPRTEPLPTSLEIAEMEEALGWLEHLRDEEERVRRAVHLRADGLTLRQIGPRLGCSFVWASKLEARGVAVIAAALRNLSLMPGLSTCTPIRRTG